jgi:hypothetical protein
MTKRIEIRKMHWFPLPRGIHNAISGEDFDLQGTYLRLYQAADENGILVQIEGGAQALDVLKDITGAVGIKFGCSPKKRIWLRGQLDILLRRGLLAFDEYGNLYIVGFKETIDTAAWGPTTPSEEIVLSQTSGRTQGELRENPGRTQSEHVADPTELPDSGLHQPTNQPTNQH